MLSRWLAVFSGAVPIGVLGLFLFGLNGLLVGFFGGLFVLVSSLTTYVEAEARIKALEERVESLETELDVDPDSEAAGD